MFVCSKAVQQNLLGIRAFPLYDCLIVRTLMQTKDQLADIKRDFASLQSTSLVSDLNISLEEVIWASDMVTSRSFAFQKQLGAPLLTLVAAALLVVSVAVSGQAEVSG